MREFYSAAYSLGLPWGQRRIEALQDNNLELTPKELHQWRRAKGRSLAAGSEWSSPAWVVPLRPSGDVKGYALFLCEGEDPDAPPYLEGVYSTVDAAIRALRRQGAVHED